MGIFAGAGLRAQLPDQLPDQEPSSQTVPSQQQQVPFPTPSSPNVSNLLNDYTSQTGTAQSDEQGRLMREAEQRELQASQNQPPLPPEPPSPFQQMV
jgi:hypothetical protein